VLAGNPEKSGPIDPNPVPTDLATGFPVAIGIAGEAVVGLASVP